MRISPLALLRSIGLFQSWWSIFNFRSFNTVYKLLNARIIVSMR